ncbi:hypothetical protein AXX17_AT1G27720 [Arabidopsis thaliana]|jgi:hypothetical protein|uniref:Uncharacterized protein n=1 Tax=Arabidopsis thaliana TaxID=3702 RepID=A0A178W5B7_ARATH|nr:hypothetical protein AXX17_AT1G27720 [Arabidopsis thaliana]
MESSEDVENLSRAIEKLLHEKRKREASGDAFIEDADDQLFLSSLISQVLYHRSVFSFVDLSDVAANQLSGYMIES